MARVFKRGKFWYVDFSYRGRRIMRSTKQRDKKTAELIAKDIEVKIAKGEYIGIHDQPKILFRDCAEKYLAYSKTNKATTTYDRDTITLKVHFNSAFGNCFLHELEAEMIENYKAMRLSKVKPVTVNTELAVLSSMLNKAIQWGYLKDSPMKAVKLLKQPPGRVRYLEPDDVNRLVEACTKYLRPIVLCALNTGMRKGEILNLKWDDIDFNNKIILLEKTKNNRRRTIPMSGVLCSVLRKLPRTGEHVFCNRNGERLINSSVHKSFKATCKKAAINDFRFHDLRHTFGAHLAMSGCNMRTIQELLGHTTIGMTERYTHLSKEHKEEAVNLVGAKLSPRVDTNLKQRKVHTDEVQVSG